jgi:hypothetical protein
MSSRRAVTATVSRARRAAILALSACATLAACAIIPAFAHADTVATIRPSFLPDRLGANTAFTFSLRFSSGAEEVPAPLSRAVVHLPAGLHVDLGRVSSCSKARLQARGAAGCAQSSLVGRGHALLELHPASQTISEEATLSAFRGPNQHGRPVIEILSQGYTPLDERAVITGVLQPDLAPYGVKLAMSIPLIPTLLGEPNASTTSFSLTIGGPGRPRAHAAGAITVPRSCPAGGFPFAADFTFEDGSMANASARARCP